MGRIFPDSFSYEQEGVETPYGYAEDKIAKILNSDDGVIDKLSKNDVTAIAEAYSEKNADGQNIKTADWPGWERLIGKKPVAGAEARTLFREERLRMIAADETPVELDHVPRVVVHMIPHEKHELDLLAGVDRSLVSNKLMPMVSQHMPQNEYGIDADAERIVSYTSGDKGFPSYAYSQLFADGAIEIVRASYYEKEHRLIADEYEDDVVNAVQRGLVLQDVLGVEAPISVMLSLPGVAGCQIGDRNLFPQRRPIKEDELNEDEGGVIQQPQATLHFRRRGVVEDILRCGLESGWPAQNPTTTTQIIIG